MRKRVINGSVCNLNGPSLQFLTFCVSGFKEVVASHTRYCGQDYVDDGFCDEIPALTAGFASKGFDQGFCPSWICGKDGLRVRSESIQNSRSSRIELDVKKLLNAAFQIA
jgi:hypothetical protein